MTFEEWWKDFVAAHPSEKGNKAFYEKAFVAGIEYAQIVLR